MIGPKAIGIVVLVALLAGFGYAYVTSEDAQERHARIQAEKAEQDLSAQRIRELRETARMYGD